MHLLRGTITVVRTLVDPFLTMRAHWLGKRHPIFRAEVARPIPLFVLKSSMLGTLVIQSLAGSWGKAVWGVVLFILAWLFGFRLLMVSLLIFTLIPFAPWLWRVPTALVAALPVAREVERRRWLALRSTPYSTREIVLALHAAGTYRVIRLWNYVMGVRLAVGGCLLALLLVAVTLSVFEVTASGLIGRVAKTRLLLVEWTAYVLSILYFLAEPLLDVGVDGALGILAATFSHSQLNAMLNGFLLRLSLWAFQVFCLMLVLPVAHQALTPGQAGNLPALVILGPAYGLLMDFSPLTTIVMVIVVVALRLVSLHVFLKVAVWRAEMIAM